MFNKFILDIFKTYNNGKNIIGLMYNAISTVGFSEFIDIMILQ